MSLENPSDNAREAIDTARETLKTARETVDRTKDYAQRAVGQGYESARQYASNGIAYASDMGDVIADFVKREPWIAMAGAFLIGYAAAQIFRRVA
jgi:hypothetical protein